MLGTDSCSSHFMKPMESTSRNAIEKERLQKKLSKHSSLSKLELSMKHHFVEHGANTVQILAKREKLS